MMTENISVSIRVRPLNTKETSRGSASAWSVDGPTIASGSERYTFDNILCAEETTQSVYDKVASDIVDSVISGINGTVFAYGQTASGKTHTMTGSEDSPGILRLAAEHIFSKIAECTGQQFLLHVSFLEIYNEQIKDLLNENPDSPPLRIRENRDKTFYVDNMTNVGIASVSELLELLARGEQLRHVGTTNMNEKSSRSHTIFTIKMESRKLLDQQNRRLSESSDDYGFGVLSSRLNLVDLAGSECVKNTGAAGGRLKEGANINKSLLALSRVISELALAQKGSFINFRDSKLTQILQPSIAGNCRTAVICCVSPADSYVEETRSTLKFAGRAKQIRTKAVVNEILDDAGEMKKLKRDLQRMRHELELSQKAAALGDGVSSKELLAVNAEKELLNEKINRLTALIIGDVSFAEGDTETSRRRRKKRETWCPGASQSRASSIRGNVVDEITDEAIGDHRSSISSSSTVPQPRGESEGRWQDDVAIELQRQLSSTRVDLEVALERGEALEAQLERKASVEAALDEELVSSRSTIATNEETIAELCTKLRNSESNLKQSSLKLQARDDVVAEQANDLRRLASAKETLTARLAGLQRDFESMKHCDVKTDGTSEKSHNEEISSLNTKVLEGNCALEAARRSLEEGDAQLADALAMCTTLRKENASAVSERTKMEALLLQHERDAETAASTSAELRRLLEARDSEHAVAVSALEVKLAHAADESQHKASDAAEITARLREIEAASECQREAAEAAADAADATIAKLEKDLSDTKAELAMSVEARRDAEASLKELDDRFEAEAITRNTVAQREGERLADAIKSADKYATEADGLREAMIQSEVVTDELKRSLNELRETCEEKRVQIESAHSELGEIRLARDAVFAELATARKGKKDAVTERDQAIAMLGEVKAELEDAKHAIAALRESTSTLTLEKSGAEERRRSVEAERGEIASKLENLQAELCVAATARQHDAEVLANKEACIAELNAALSAVEAAKAEAEEHRRSAETEKGEVTAKLENLHAELRVAATAHLHDAKVLATKENSIAEMNGALGAVEAAKAELEMRVEELESELRCSKMLEIELGDARAKADRFQDELTTSSKSKAEQVASLECKITEIEDRLASVNTGLEQEQQLRANAEVDRDDALAALNAAALAFEEREEALNVRIATMEDTSKALRAELSGHAATLAEAQAATSTITAERDSLSAACQSAEAVVSELRVALSAAESKNATNVTSAIDATARVEAEMARVTELSKRCEGLSACLKEVTSNHDAVMLEKAALVESHNRLAQQIAEQEGEGFVHLTSEEWAAVESRGEEWKLRETKHVEEVATLNSRIMTLESSESASAATGERNKMLAEELSARLTSVQIERDSGFAQVARLNDQISSIKDEMDTVRQTASREVSNADAKIADLAARVERLHGEREHGVAVLKKAIADKEVAERLAEARQERVAKLERTKISEAECRRIILLKKDHKKLTREHKLLLAKVAKFEAATRDGANADGGEMTALRNENARLTQALSSLASRVQRIDLDEEGSAMSKIADQLASARSELEELRATAKGHCAKSRDSERVIASLEEEIGDLRADAVSSREKAEREISTLLQEHKENVKFLEKENLALMIQNRNFREGKSNPTTHRMDPTPQPRARPVPCKVLNSNDSAIKENTNPQPSVANEERGSAVRFVQDDTSIPVAEDKPDECTHQ